MLTRSIGVVRVVYKCDRESVNGYRHPVFRNDVVDDDLSTRLPRQESDDLFCVDQ